MGTNSLSMFHFYHIKAYDFIYHGILLAKLLSYGTGGTKNLTLNLYLLYLKNLSRNKQEWRNCLHNNSASSFTEMNHGMLTGEDNIVCGQHVGYWNNEDIVKY